MTVLTNIFIACSLFEYVPKINYAKNIGYPRLYKRLYFFQDVRTIDPNFIKLYKLAQLIIEYLLVSLCLLSFIFFLCII